MSHGNELSSRVEMRHRADAVFHVSTPITRVSLYNGTYDIHSVLHRTSFRLPTRKLLLLYVSLRRIQTLYNISIHVSNACKNNCSNTCIEKEFLISDVIPNFFSFSFIYNAAYGTARSLCETLTTDSPTRSFPSRKFNYLQMLSFRVLSLRSVSAIFAMPTPYVQLFRNSPR